LLENVVIPNGADVFACVQNDTLSSDEELTEWFIQEFQGRLRSLEWFNLENYPDWVIHRERILSGLQMPPSWKHYLRISGAMIEYYQLFLANNPLCAFEYSSFFKYDYVIRVRTDNIFAVPVDFHWLRWSDDEVQARLDRLAPQCASEDLLAMFMATVLFPDHDFPADVSHVNYQQTLAEECSLPALNGAEVNRYLREGRYILTMRRNNLYVVRRACFYLLPSTGVCYGHHPTPATDDRHYWFNAECQFRSACYHANVTIFDYSSALEGSSLNLETWKEETFFEADGTPKRNMLFCVVRR